MRFQTPALAIGLFASLALASGEPTIRIQVQFDGPDDDAKMFCMLQTEGLCAEGTSNPDTETLTIGDYNEQTERCQFRFPWRDLCGKNSEGNAKGQLQIESHEDGHYSFHYYDFEDDSWGPKSSCDVDSLSPDVECHPELNPVVPPPPRTSVPVSSTALPTPSASVAVTRLW